MNTNTIFIRDLRIKMQIGIFDHEKGRTQPVLIDADIVLAPSRWAKDDISETVAYDDVVARIEAIAKKQHFNLIEFFLEKAAEDLLSIGKIQSVKISAAKPCIIKNAGRVGVEIVRNKA